MAVPLRSGLNKARDVSHYKITPSVETSTSIDAIPMTPEERQTITSYGTYIYHNSVNAIMTVAGYGLSILGIFIAIQILVTKSLTVSRVALLACLIMSLIALTGTTFFSGAFPLIQVQSLFIEIKPGVQGALEAQNQVEKKNLLPLYYIPSWAMTVAGLLSDAVVVWRAWVLFQQERLWKVTLALLMIVNIGINIAGCIWDSIEVTITGSSSSSILDWVSVAVSLVVNVFATGLIAWKAWSYHRIVADAAIRRRTKVENMLLLMIESGAVYCIMQVVFIVASLLDIYAPVSGWFGQILGIIETMAPIATAWYPIAVITLINMGHSSVVETFHIRQTTVGTGREGHISSMTVHSNTGRTPFQ
ncbi:hypothetical protein GYMLUDRAFT_246372 [Collybiopsis luxurians FD-317 M1]|uniref:Unplaced genomic scaffold GYMLUscaffold_39, whole genome shotgun sequence n=1 Tax=Collybiopsis luxurians FD-317 M1 TaxID=944289 RepID=A0A0D0C680_9AGAR|nr:hypothetical protein GYMLUDRAFT_246372 [Collybiopsis luxurians FD-317 M1]